jgi:DNA-directed RNA polymerase subunit RPC12/RpoP
MSKLYGCANCELKFTITIEDEPGVMTPMVKPAIIHCPVCGGYYPFSKVEEED